MGTQSTAANTHSGRRLTQRRLTADDYKRLNRLIRHYIARAYPRQAEDLTAEVFLRAVQAERNGFGCRKALTPWLYQIARSVMADHGRRRRREPVFVPLDSILNLPAQENVEEVVLGSLAAARLALGLDKDKRKLLQLLLDGYSRRQMGAVYGIDERAAKARVHRLRKQLKGRRKDEG